MGPARDLKFNRFRFFFFFLQDWCTGRWTRAKSGPTLIRFRAREKLTVRRILPKKKKEEEIDQDKNYENFSLFSPSDFRLRQIFLRIKCNYRHKETRINEITIFREGESAETGETRVRYYLFEEYWIADPGKYHFFRRKLNLTFLACPFILMGQRSILVASNCRATNPNRSHVYTQKGITRNYNAARYLLWH